MAKTKSKTAWVLVKDDGQLGQWIAGSTLVFETPRAAKQFAKRVVGKTPLRDQYRPRPLVGRLMDRVKGRPVAVRQEDADGTANYTVLFDVTNPADAFAIAREIAESGEE